MWEYIYMAQYREDKIKEVEKLVMVVVDNALWVETVSHPR